jgi:hypothetical protein
LVLLGDVVAGFGDMDLVADPVADLGCLQITYIPGWAATAPNEHSSRPYASDQTAAGKASVHSS